MMKSLGPLAMLLLFIACQDSTEDPVDLTQLHDTWELSSQSIDNEEVVPLTFYAKTIQNDGSLSELEEQLLTDPIFKFDENVEFTGLINGKDETHQTSILTMSFSNNADLKFHYSIDNNDELSINIAVERQSSENIDILGNIYSAYLTATYRIVRCDASSLELSNDRINLSFAK